ncbi:unnamed protein product, partial [Prorocentrum cordatum]
EGPDQLQSYVKGRHLHGSLRDEELSIGAILDRLAHSGPSALAEEAGDHLDQIPRAGEGCVGSGPGCAKVAQPSWPGGDGYRRGELLLAGLTFPTYDDRDTIRLSRGLRKALQLGGGKLEERQCMLRADSRGRGLPGAGLPGGRSSGPGLDPQPRVGALPRLQVARGPREGLWAEASAATRAPGEAPERIDRAEREVRGCIRDVPHPRRNKDCRSLRTFPLERLGDVVLNFVRVDSPGRVIFERVSGSAAGPQAKQRWQLIHGRRARIFRAGPEIDEQTLLADLTQRANNWGGSPPCDYVALGWKALLNQVAGDVAPIDPPTANEDTALTIAGWGLQAWSRRRCRARDVPDAVTMPDERLVALEVMAGSGHWTQTWRARGLTAQEPIECYQDPLERTGPRGDRNARGRGARRRILQDIAESEVNAIGLESVCANFRPWIRCNGGARAAAHPDGVEPLLPSEEAGKDIAEVIERSLDRGKLARAENPAPDGIYPAIWGAERGRRERVSLGGPLPGTSRRHCWASQVCHWTFVEILAQGALAGAAPAGGRAAGDCDGALGPQGQLDAAVLDPEIDSRETHSAGAAHEAEVRPRGKQREGQVDVAMFS